MLWYAKAVGVLQQRPITDRTSWRFLAAIHGFDESMWSDAGYLHNGEKLPAENERQLYWKQCQHSNWMFLPWHRGYVASFEQIVRDAVVKLGGPKDWALPYWNYNEGQKALQLPPCFAARTLPDGGGKNPLYVERRYGPNGDGKVVLIADLIGLGCLDDPVFEGGYMGNPPGFGGTPSSLGGHKSGIRGGLEARPHNIVHTEVGGEDQVTPLPEGQQPAQGLMSYPQTAALDPIFWLHHANIDRLWDVWLQRDPINHNPGTSLWLDGPPANGRAFVVPHSDGQPWSFKVREMLDTRAPQLDYVYEDTSDPLPGQQLFAERLKTLGAQPQQITAAAVENKTLTPATPAELLGANDQTLVLSGGNVDTSVRLDQASTGTLMGNLKSKAFAATVPEHSLDRVFLNLENIRGDNDGATFDVYLSFPVPGQHSALPDQRVGSISLFGVRKASRPDSQHGGKGVSHVLDITEVFDKLSASSGPLLGQLSVRFVPVTDVRAEDRITVGRVSLYRQGN